MGEHVPYAAGVIVLNDDGEVLLLRNRWRRTWEYRGGKVTSGEFPAEAARREILEETGLEVNDLTYVGDDDSMGVPYSTYRGTVRGRPSVRTRRLEHSAAGWFGRGEAVDTVDRRLRGRLARYLGVRGTGG